LHTGSVTIEVDPDRPVRIALGELLSGMAGKRRLAHACHTVKGIDRYHRALRSLLGDPCA
jgi:hypothetical protein